MKAIVCEMCSSNEFVKEDGYYICQHCGTRYTVEEAKKLMVEGTVKIDNSELIKKFLLNARRAKQKEDWKEAEKYYNMVEQNEPTNIEAIFYSSFAQVKNALLEKDTKEKRQNVFNILIKGVSVIDDNYDNTNEEHLKILFEILEDINGLSTGTIVPTTYLQDYVTRNEYGTIVDRTQIVEDDSLSVTYNMINAVFVAYMDSLANIIANYSPKEVIELFMKNIGRLPWKSPIFNKVVGHIEGYRTPEDSCAEIAKQVNVSSESTKQEINEQINELAKTICPFYTTNGVIWDNLRNLVYDNLRIAHPNVKALKTGGCYVATCVYGSYNCPQVWTLRRYRDNKLGATWYGRVFIHLYYAISPTMVRLFGNKKWFHKLWRGKLDRMVRKLNSKGVEDTPYQDKQW